jgi:hypothetical protein
MAALQRFSISDVEKIKFMASFGHDGTSIARALGRTAQAVRVKCVELGIPLRQPSADGRRFKLSPECWTVLQREAQERGTKPGHLARLLVETAVKAKLIDAILDDDSSPPKQKATELDPAWREALARECKPTPVSYVEAFTPRLTGMVINAQLMGTA